MKKATFEKLKQGDSVETKSGVKAIVKKVNCFGNMVMLKTEKRIYGCPYFYKHELK